MCTYDAFYNNLRILKKRLQHFIIKQPTHFVIRGVVFYFPRENIQTFKKEWYFAGSEDQLSEPSWNTVLLGNHVSLFERVITLTLSWENWVLEYMKSRLTSWLPRGRKKASCLTDSFRKFSKIKSPKYALQTKNSSNQSAGVMRRMFDSLPLELRDSFLRANMNIISFAQFLETNKQKTYRFKLLWVNNKLTHKLK